MAYGGCRDCTDMAREVGDLIAHASDFDASADISSALNGGQVRGGMRMRGADKDDKKVAERTGRKDGPKAKASRRDDPVLDAYVAAVQKAGRGMENDPGLSM